MHSLRVTAIAVLWVILLSAIALPATEMDVREVALVVLVLAIILISPVRDAPDGEHLAG